jgi:hypothetical protein
MRSTKVILICYLHFVGEFYISYEIPHHVSVYVCLFICLSVLSSFDTYSVTTFYMIY